MARVERTALLAFDAAQMLALVQDVVHYPQFLPGCTSAVIEQSELSRVRARLGFRVKGLTDQFATENVVSRQDDGSLLLKMRLLEGPFKRLDGEWRFLPLAEQACKISLVVELDFGLRALESLLASQMERAVSAVIEAFKTRAEALYGKS